MKRVRNLLWVTLIVFFTAVPVAFSQSQPADDQEDGTLVGRISEVQGELLRYVPAEEDWVATVQDAPFGLDDALYSDEKGKAEFVMPNGSWVRIDGNTQIQMIALKEDVTELDVASGVARFYNKGRDTIIKATTPFGYIIAPAGTTFDLYVGDESVEVIALKGQVDFILESDESRYEVTAGSSSIIADGREVTSGEGTVDADWDDWNLDRDALWAKRLEVKGESVKYVPEQLEDEAYTLEENGKWETVEYEGARHTFWRPVRVAADWQPYSVGRWTVYYEDNCWIPDEPFGYVTHHYGNWVYAHNYWYWAPPVVRVRVGAPVLGIGLGWYPGRVAWIHSGVSVGWVPLAPFEPYYSYRHWGRRSILINNVNIARVNINIGNLRYVNRAFIVNQNNFYGVRNYRNVRITNINRNVIINNYRAAPVVNNTVIRNYTNNRQRYNYTNVNVTRKPHSSVINRIQRNERLARDSRSVNANAIRQNVNRTKEGRLNRDARIERPKAADRLVAPRDVNKPKSDMKFQERDLKGKTRGQDEVQRRREAQPQVREPKRPEGRRGGPVTPGEDQRRVRPERPDRTGQDVVPGDRGQRRAPVEDQRRVRPERPDRSGQEVVPGDRGQRRAPVEDQRRVRPERPDRTVQPDGATERQNRRGPVTQDRRRTPDEMTTPGGPSQQQGPGRQMRGGDRRQQPDQMTPGGPGQQLNRRGPMREDRRQGPQQMAPGAPGQQPNPARLQDQRRGRQPQDQVQQGGQRQQPPAGDQRKNKKKDIQEPQPPVVR